MRIILPCLAFLLLSWAATQRSKDGAGRRLSLLLSFAAALCLGCYLYGKLGIGIPSILLNLFGKAGILK